MFRIRTTVFTALSLALLSYSALTYAAQEKPNGLEGSPTQWAATKWSAQDLSLFGGFPKYTGDHKHLVVIRYTYYVSNYDADRLCPLWVAHIDYSDGLEKMSLRENSDDPRWSRKGTVFYPDELLVTYSKDPRHPPYVVNRSYEKCNPPELSEKIAGMRGTPAKITRGHNASNLEMKVQGSDDEGDHAQAESFSLANVAPQMQAHNSPMWSELEKSCLVWAQAKEIGKVAIFTGPVFSPEATDFLTGERNPLPVKAQIETIGEKGPMIPIPTHFFKVVIGIIDSKLSAIGFLVPHLATLEQDDFMKYKVPISEIEKRTHLVFMPDATIPAYKDAVDNRWIQILKAERRTHQKKLKNVAQVEENADLVEEEEEK